MKLVVGLGNPGKEYQGTRHNLGFWLLDSLAQDLKISIDKKKFGGLYEETNMNGEKIILLKPQKYINLSGDVIIKFIDYYKINIEDILIVHDDLDLMVGKFKLKQSGSSGGHNGLKNIEQNLKTDIFNRLKIGISNNKMMETKDYVLGRFDDDEKKSIEDIISICKQIIIDFSKDDILTLMNRYNHK